MKKTDIAMIILIAGVSVVVAFIIAGTIPWLKTSDLKATYPTAPTITSDVSTPDTRLFGENAINPTQQTIIGQQ